MSWASSRRPLCTSACTFTLHFHFFTKRQQNRSVIHIHSPAATISSVPSEPSDSSALQVSRETLKKRRYQLRKSPQNPRIQSSLSPGGSLCREPESCFQSVEGPIREGGRSAATRSSALETGSLDRLSLHRKFRLPAEFSGHSVSAPSSRDLLFETRSARVERVSSVPLPLFAASDGQRIHSLAPRSSIRSPSTSPSPRREAAVPSTAIRLDSQSDFRPR